MALHSTLAHGCWTKATGQVFGKLFQLHHNQLNKDQYAHMIVTTVMSGRSGIIPFIGKSQDQRPDRPWLNDDNVTLNSCMMLSRKQGKMSAPLPQGDHVCPAAMSRGWHHCQWSGLWPLNTWLTHAFTGGQGVKSLPAVHSSKLNYGKQVDQL